MNGTDRKYSTQGWLIFFILFLFCSCATNRFPGLLVAEEQMVQNCEYLDTISEISDPGKPGSSKYAKYYDGELKVLERAHYLGATHIVWLYNHAMGSSASAYRCVE